MLVLKTGIVMVFAAVLLLVIYTDAFASKQPDISLEPGQTFRMTKYFAGTGNGETVGMFAAVLKEGREVAVQVAAPDGSIALKTKIGSKSQPVIGTFPVKQAGNYTLTIKNSNEQNARFVAAFSHVPTFDAREPYLQALSISAILLMIGFMTTVAGFVVYFFIDRRRNRNSPDQRMIQSR
jgi:hypothetical protein